MDERVDELQHRAPASDGALAHPAVLPLDDRRARDAALAGAKAAALATAAAAGLPVLPGAVLTTAAGRIDGEVHEQLRRAWATLTDGGRHPLAVRSSSTVEDQATTSMAGHFTTVLDVAGWPETVDAVRRVAASADGAPMAVLLQPMCDVAIGGVLFGVDPVTGRSDRLVVETVRGTPDALVRGDIAAGHQVLTGRGRQVAARGEPTVRARDRRRLARLARRAAATFGAAQDIEWAMDRDGRLWLLQSRPVTAIAAGVGGPRLGPGPVAETFPDPLAPLEVDLWVEPLRAGIVEALRLTGADTRRRIDRSPVLVVVGGRVAADLDLLEGGRRSRLTALVDPRPAALRIAASWRVGRLRRALPLLAADIVGAIDRDLAAVPSLDEPTDAELVGLLGRTRLALRAACGYEVLAGALVVTDGITAIDVALGAVAAGRAAGLDDGALVAAHPVALALATPRVGAPPALPAVAVAPATAAEALGPREALRLRGRWLQELSARAAAELGRRLAAAGRLEDASDVRLLTLEELAAMVRDGGPAPDELLERALDGAGPPLPATFRLDAGGRVVAVTGNDRDGEGAGGGRGCGPVAAPDDDPAGTVLVVRTLEPSLAPRLAGRAGLVAETGSVLAHLAIVARELGVPTAVGVPDAVRRFPPGTVVVVDGRTGEVCAVEGDR